jgi:predicted RNA-binding Zn ribbon-like protein
LESSEAITFEIYLLTYTLLCYRQHMPVNLDAFPVIGEHLAVELANTLYDRPADPIDFLDSNESITAWFGLAAPDAPVAMPRRIERDRADTLRQLRTATRTLLVNAATGSAPSSSAINTLNQCASLVPVCYQFAWTNPHGPIATLFPVTRGVDAVITFLALQAISFVTGPDLAFVRRCDGRDCPMLFVQRHHKRRFCYDGCSHRSRQARYYQAHHRPTKGPLQ